MKLLRTDGRTNRDGLVGAPKGCERAQKCCGGFSRKNQHAGMYCSNISVCNSEDVKVKEADKATYFNGFI
jgi:hypothetical protein